MKGACQFHKRLIASRFIHVKHERESREKAELKQCKICLVPLKSNLHNKQREEKRTAKDEMGKEEKGKGKGEQC